MFKFFVNTEQIDGETVSIVNDDVNHIKNVLRLCIGDRIQVCDITKGENYVCEIMKLEDKIISTRIIQSIESVAEAGIYLHIFQGLPKAEKLETIIQKTTEIGVSEITPVCMKRCIVKLEHKDVQKKVDRWNKIAEVAAKQSKRDKIPIINEPINFRNIYEKIENYDIVIVAYENEEENTIKKVLKQLDKTRNLKIAIIIGPEGGIDSEEIALLKDLKASIVTLGKRILRTETAPIVLSSVVMYELDELA